MDISYSLSESFETIVEQTLMDRSPVPYVDKLYLVIGSRSVIRRTLNSALAQFALAGPVHVLDGGNLFDFYAVARMLRARTARLEEVLERIDIARAFTCYQVITLLSQTPESSYPIFILDLLSTFYDESVAIRERKRLLQQSIRELRRLGSKAPVILSATPGEGEEAGELIEHLEEACSQVWRHRDPSPSILYQPRLF
jgi:hypothetical protein